jgi:hypothetical protein
MRAAMSRFGSDLLTLCAGMATVLLLRRSFHAGRSSFSGLRTLFDLATEALDRKVGWDKVPVPVALITFIGLRDRLREKNLFDPLVAGARTTDLTPLVPTAAVSTTDAGPGDEAEMHLVARTADGTFNDLHNPSMGSAGTRFGRNVPLNLGFPESREAILSPNPRVISLQLLARDTFVPATTINLLAASWLQFMIRDWLSHGRSPTDDPWVVPLPPGDDWPEPTMQILRTPDDPTRTAADSGLPPTHINTETHWWDGSQLYGSSKQIQMKVRSGTDGKLTIDERGLPPADPDSIDQPGFWIGLGMLQVLFTLEHNAICDRLKTEYPGWSDEDIFQRARLINAALLAKIHTVEWTPAIISNPATKVAMRANWWGLEGESIHNVFGRLSGSEVISGIPGSHQDHYGVPYALTEEFVAVYKLHALIPDDYSFRSSTNDAVLLERTFPQIANTAALELLTQVSPTDLFYSFGTSHPGAIQLHNYPRSLLRFLRPDGNYLDLAATDILRARELGVPRYNEFRRLLHKNPVRSFEELTDNPVWREELRRVYDNDIERVDPMVGLYCEPKPVGFGFSDTAFRIFILMASRRLNSDRFFTDDFTPRVYTKMGMDWIENNTMATVLLRHFPGLAPVLREVENAFAPWATAAG